MQAFLIDSDTFMCRIIPLQFIKKLCNKVTHNTVLHNRQKEHQINTTLLLMAGLAWEKGFEVTLHRAVSQRKSCSKEYVNARATIQNNMVVEKFYTQISTKMPPIVPELRTYNHKLSPL